MKTSIPKDKWGVHETHCCSKHGCKYGGDNCPVELNLIKQKFPCESCEDMYLTNDPKYLGIPNISFSLTKEDDKREPDFRKQRVDRGFDDSETWSLRDTIANFIIPRLEEFEKITDGMFDISPKVIKKRKKFLKALKLIARDEGACIFTKKEQKQVNKGLKAFPEIFMSLWW